MIKIKEAYQKKGYWAERFEDYVLVWHRNNQIALLANSSDIERQIEEVVGRRIRELREIEEKTGWKDEE